MFRYARHPNDSLPERLVYKAMHAVLCTHTCCATVIR